MRLVVALIAAPLAAQSWQAGMATPMQTFAAFGPQVATRTSKESFPVRLRITASRQPIATLRTVARAIPEGAALYAVQACNVSAGDLSIDSGVIEQALESRGIAITSRSLVPMTLERSRGIGRSVAARVADVLLIAGPLALSFAAGGTIKLNGWQVGAISGLSTGLQVLGKATESERSIGLPILGTLLGDVPNIKLRAGECSGRYLAMGSYSRGQSATVVIEE